MWLIYGTHIMSLREVVLGAALNESQADALVLMFKGQLAFRNIRKEEKRDN